VYSRDTGRGNSREGGEGGGSECTVGTRVGATVGRGLVVQQSEGQSANGRARGAGACSPSSKDATHASVWSRIRSVNPALHTSTSTPRDMPGTQPGNA
jgi:hypothetical protein